MHEDGKRDPADEDESGASLAAKAHMAKAASVKNFASNLKKERQKMNNKRLYIQLGDASDQPAVREGRSHKINPSPCCGWLGFEWLHSSLHNYTSH